MANFHWSAEEGTALTDALLHSGKDSLDPTQSLNGLFLFADRGWWIWLISPFSPLPSGCAQGCEACGAAAPSLAEAEWPFPMKPEGLSSDSLLQCDCHTIS